MGPCLKRLLSLWTSTVKYFSDFSSKAKTTLDGPIYRVISNRLSEEESPKTYEYVMIKFLIIVSEVYRTLLLKLQAIMPLVGDLHQDSMNLIIQLFSLIAPGTQLTEYSAEELAEVKLDHLTLIPSRCPFM